MKHGTKIENRKVVYPDRELVELLKKFKSKNPWMDSDSKLFVSAMKYYLSSVWALPKEEFTVDWLPRRWKGRHTGRSQKRVMVRTQQLRTRRPPLT